MLTYRIEYDQEPCNPRNEWDNLGTIVYAHRRSRLGDIDATKEYPDADNWDDIERLTRTLLDQLDIELTIETDKEL